MNLYPLAVVLLALAPLGLIAGDGARDAVRARAVALDPADPARRTVGALAYLGGWALRSEDRRFGGLSTLTLQGDRLVAIADDGIVAAFRIDRGGATSAMRIFDLPDGPGDAHRKRDRDSESSTFDPVTGRTWVGFETSNEIWRYGRGLGRAEAHAAPPAMANWPSNRGAEAMARLPDGRFLVIEETRGGRDGSHRALLFPGDPTAPGATPIRFGYRAVEGFGVSDAAALPDGRVLILQRRVTLWHGWQAALSLFDPAAIRGGRTIGGREIARLGRPLALDNMEGIAIGREGGRTIVWLVSDDNFLPVERTLLMKFALDVPGGDPAR